MTQVLTLEELQNDSNYYQMCYFLNTCVIKLLISAKHLRLNCINLCKLSNIWHYTSPCCPVPHLYNVFSFNDLQVMRRTRRHKLLQTSILFFIYSIIHICLVKSEGSNGETKHTRKYFDSNLQKESNSTYIKINYRRPTSDRRGKIAWSKK